MKGLRKVCSDTKGLHGYYSGEYIELFYNADENSVFSVYHWNLGHNQWTIYAGNIVPCGVIDSPKTQEEIREIIAETLERRCIA